MNEEIRKVVFISHANPEDNIFTIWLGSKLAMAGYEVWSDLTNLKGGEYFWDDIQDVIENHAAKVIVVMTPEAMQRKGVKDEIQLGVDTEAKLNDPEFVIPVVYKPFDFKRDSPPQIRRKNAVSIKNWAKGLAQLLEKLDDDKVPKSNDINPTINSWKCAFSEDDSVVKNELEILHTNWHSISLPKEIAFYNVEGVKGSHEVPSIAKIPKCPGREYFRLLTGFGEAEDYNSDLSPSYGVNIRCTEETNDFLAGQTKEVSSVHPREAKKITSSLIKKGLENFLESKGLKPYEQADGFVVWWFPQGHLEADKIHYLKLNGKKAHRKICGKSLALFWHFGIKVRPVINKEPYVIFSPHVIFSQEGNIPISGKDYQHKKRRSACKTWRNDKWRDLLSATLCWLSDGSSEIVIPMGSNRSFTMASTPILVESPVSIDIEKLKGEANSDDFLENDELDNIEDSEEPSFEEEPPPEQDPEEGEG